MHCSHAQLHFRTALVNVQNPSEILLVLMPNTTYPLMRNTLKSDGFIQYLPVKTDTSTYKIGPSGAPGLI
jgi:hypothetical protein